jgi:hypothetical protein
MCRKQKNGFEDGFSTPYLKKIKNNLRESGVLTDADEFRLPVERRAVYRAVAPNQRGVTRNR